MYLVFVAWSKSDLNVPSAVGYRTFCIKSSRGDASEALKNVYLPGTLRSR